MTTSFDRFLETVQRLVEHESPTGDVARNRSLADIHWLPKWRPGEPHVERHEGPGYGDHLVGRFPGPETTNGSAPSTDPLLLLGHMDTVHPAGSLAEMPFGQRDGTLTGPGVFDMKSGVTLALVALDEVARRRAEGEGPGLPGPVTLLVTCDEEVGSPTSRALIEELARSSRATLVLEPCLPGGVVKTARKGVADYYLTVKGVPAHAGIEPEKGASAIHALVDAIGAILPLARPDIGTTISVGKISGGTAMNVVAAEAKASVDVRFWTREEADRIDAAIRSHQPADSRCTIHVGGGVNRYPLEETQASRALFERAAEMGAALGLPMEAGRTGGGSDVQLHFSGRLPYA